MRHWERSWARPEAVGAVVTILLCVLIALGLFVAGAIWRGYVTT